MHYSVKRFLTIFTIVSFSFGSLSATRSAKATRALSFIFLSPDFLKRKFVLSNKYTNKKAAERLFVYLLDKTNFLLNTQTNCPLSFCLRIYWTRQFFFSKNTQTKRRRSVCFRQKMDD